MSVASYKLSFSPLKGQILDTDRTQSLFEEQNNAFPIPL